MKECKKIPENYYSELHQICYKKDVFGTTEKVDKNNY